MGTFLRTLGNKLYESLPGVITVVPVDAKELLKSNLLLNKERERHLFIYVPLIDYEKMKADNFLKGRLDLRSNVSDILLTIGRLDPAKGQTKLIKAWGDSQLRDSFNLVIIGGDIENPYRVELDELEEIRKYAQENHRIQGRFCHLPTMNNDEIGCLENSISQVKATPWPPIYVASFQRGVRHSNSRGDGGRLRWGLRSVRSV